MPNPFEPGDELHDLWEAENRRRQTTTGPVRSDTAEPDEPESGKPTQATVLVRLAMDRYRLVTGDDGRPYAVAKTGAAVARPLRGANGLRKHLARLYAETCRGAAPSQSGLADALTVLEGYAADSPPQPIYLRSAPYRTGVALDLGTVDGRCALADPSGWRIVDRAPVLFRRTNLTLPLAEPVPGGDIWPLLALVNTDQARRQLLIGWLLAALLPDMPHPILAIFGEQGTAKSTATRLLVQLIDASPAPLRTQPRDARQWAITANASWTVALENVSDIAAWLSDALCRAVTGDGYVDRALYSDDDVSVLRFRRVIALNGISVDALRGDLADRFLSVELHVIDPTSRRSDSEIQADAAAAAPGALGGLLDLLVKVLAVLPTVHLARAPRMADFARVLAALDQVTGWNTLADYQADAGTLAGAVVDSDRFATALRTLLAGRPEWIGTPTDLLDLLPVPEPTPRNWPKTAQAIAGHLARTAPALRQLGYTIAHADKDKTTRRQRWHLAAPADAPVPEKSTQPTFGTFEPSEPQVSGPKDARRQPSPPGASPPDAKDHRAEPSPTFTHADQAKHANRESSKVPKDQSVLLSGPATPPSEGTPA